MNCDAVRQQLPDQVLGTLSETETAAIRRHLRGCASCREDATELDQGVALFAGAAHVAEPPTDLKERVLAVLEEEWAEASPLPQRRRFHFAAQAMAAALIVLAGVGAWAGVAQTNANRFREDAVAYRKFLSALGGKDIRAGTLSASPGVTLDGSIAVYDSDKGQSWVLVLARAPGGYSEPLTVTLQAPGGRQIIVPFPLKFDSNGEGWTAMVSGVNLTSFNHVVLTGVNGRVVAAGRIPPE